MKIRIWATAAAAVAAILALRISPLPSPQPVASRGTAAPDTPPAPVAVARTGVRPAPAKPAPPVERRLRRTSESTWEGAPLEKTFVEFSRWVRSYLAETDPGRRVELEAEGIRRARARREDLLGLIRSHPERALELAVPAAVRKLLPASVRDLLEERIDTRGDLAVLAAIAQPGHESEIEPLYRTATVQGRVLRANVYGRRLGEPTRFDIPLHGIAVDDQAAFDENPIRVLEPSEAGLPGSFGDPLCAVSESPADAFGELEALDLGGTTAFTCSSFHAEQLNDKLITAEAGGSSMNPDGGGYLPDSPATEGVKKLIMIRVDFSDLAGAPLSDARATTIISNLNVFYSTMSYGRTGFKEVGAGSRFTPTLRLPKTAAVYGASDASVLRSDARAAARAAGIDPSGFDYDLTCFGAVPGFGWAGLGYVGAPGSWIRASFDEAGGVSAHELGHNFGLNHANFWDTGDQSTIGPGTSVEYGDGFDTMGNAGAGKRHFNARYKNLLNWLPSPGVAVFSTNGTYRIAAHDDPKSTGFRALRIAKNSVTNYWVEFRQAYTNNPWLMNGIGVRWARSGNDNRQSLLLDTTPGTADGKNDSAIVLGRTFSDRVSNIHITAVRKAGTTPESVDVYVYKGVAPSNHPPTIALKASATSVAVNGNVTFEATAADPDGDPLAYDWDFNDSTFGSNEPTASKKWAAAGEYVVRCTVSDMKGGSSSDFVVVRVGSPTTVRIAGRVLRDGKPVEGVRVYTSNTKSAWTDADGNYVLAGLAKGSYTVRASADGLLFNRSGFSNPLSVQANKTGVDFEASLPGDLANITLVPAGAVWKYLDDGSNAGTAWRARTFDDSKWNQGGAQLGYGDDDVLTKLNFGDDDQNKIITYYFRHAFELGDPTGFLSLVLGVVRDDGAVVYLNGKEVFRSNMPSGTITYTTRASASVGGADESTYFETDIDPANLIKGTNVLAVEVHQYAPDSSDVSFNLQLAGLRPLPKVLPEISLRQINGSIEVSWPDSGTPLLQSTDRVGLDALWTTVNDATYETADGIRTARIPAVSTMRYYRLISP